MVTDYLSFLNPFVYLRIQYIRLRHFTLAILLCLTLSSCSGLTSPPHKTLVDALTMKMEITQSLIDGALGLTEESSLQVSNLDVNKTEEVIIGEEIGLKVIGDFNWKIIDDNLENKSDFELFLTHGDQEQSWRLARKVVSSEFDGQEWITYPLPFD